jgi:hypothetical protein
MPDPKLEPSFTVVKNWMVSLEPFTDNQGDLAGVKLMIKNILDDSAQPSKGTWWFSLNNAQSSLKNILEALQTEISIMWPKAGYDA